MILKGSKIISRLPTGEGLAQGFEFDIDDDSVKQLVRIAASELILDSGIGELLEAADVVLKWRDQIVDYPSWGRERTERVPESALDRLAIAVANVQRIVHPQPGENDEKRN